VPYFAAAVEAMDAGRAMPEFFRRDVGFGTADDVSGLIVYLASQQSEGINGQVIGVGGDRLQLWSHPEPVLTELHAGGWTADSIAEDFAPLLRSRLQSVGEEFAPLPAEFTREA
jgi:3-oxoacyl-[acyl-carrier protein] reductase